MSATSVLTVEVQAEEFDALMKQIDKFQETAHALPDEFKAISKRMDSIFDGSITKVRKTGEEAKKQVKNVGLFEKAWDNVAKKTKAIESTVKSLGKGITTLIPGLGMAGLMAGGLLGLPAALFGLFTASQNWASNGRTQNMGLGTSQGMRTAFLNQFGTYGLNEGNLATLEEEKTDYRKAGQLALATGLSQTQASNMDTTALAIAAIQRIKQDQAAGNLAAARLHSEAAGFSAAQFHNIMDRSPEEINSDIAQMRQRSRTLETTDTEQRRAQDFMRSMSDVAENFKASFFRITESLQVPITNLVNRFKEFFTTLNDSGKLKEWIGKVGDGLEDLGKYLVSDQFQKDMAEAIKDVKEFASVISGASHTLMKLLHPFMSDADIDNALNSKDKDTVDQAKKAEALRSADVWKNAKAGAIEGGVGGAALGAVGLGFGAIPLGIAGAVGGFFAGAFLGQHQFNTRNMVPGANAVQEGSIGGAPGKPSNLAGVTEFTADRLTGINGILSRSFGIESGGDSTKVSPKGARGYLQWMPDTAKQYGVKIGDLESEKAGWVKYYTYLMNKFHDARAAAAAYNWGEGNVQKTMKAYGSEWLSHSPQETQKYVSVVVNNQTGANLSTALAGNSYMPSY
ncbi:transglycosylase SLT domain-containing protein [Paraburkholderia tropica]|uniref:transglycosylase SLT domain-containing protein n=1 Tax=Paraburkholderia tropica TaxID=92647 RepID=UPI002AB22EA8|nr:transglycosylase SLT domain-containing protein [Paraburkholderia tropica]